jgi:hypothetical protein
MMRLILTIMTLVFSLVFSSLAAQAKVTAKKVNPPKDGTNLERSLRFESFSINGKYQVPIESLTVVEDEKLLNDLLSVRKNFKDRLRVQQNHW